MQFKSNQKLSKEKLEEISILEIENPDAVEHAQMKRRWTFISKDPSKTIKNNSYWSSLNHMPPEGVGQVVTDKILKFDQETCKSILEKIFKEQKDLDNKMDI